MSEHIETLKRMLTAMEVGSRGNTHFPAMQMGNCDIQAMNWALSLLDPAKAEGHAKVLLEYCETYSMMGEHRAAYLAGAVALARVAELEAQLDAVPRADERKTARG